MGPLLLYACARMAELEERDAYRAYVAESVRMIPQRKCLAVPWHELVNGRLEQPKPGSVVKRLVERGAFTMEGEYGPA